MLGDSDKESQGREGFMGTEFPHADGQTESRNEDPQETYPAELVRRHPLCPLIQGRGPELQQPQARTTISTAAWWQQRAGATGSS